MSDRLRSHLSEGHVIPALPLALTRGGRWDEKHQRGLVRYYLDAGVGGIAVGVHSTQFAIRDPKVGLFKPVLSLAAETAAGWVKGQRRSRHVLIAGICGKTQQAIAEARFARGTGYQAGLLSLAAWKTEPEREVLAHCRAIASEIPIIGFYLQPAVGGRVFSYRFWRSFATIPNLVAIKMAPFNRYFTFDVVRAVIESGREDVTLYTGNDDNIIADLISEFQVGGKKRFIAGGLLGQFGVWTERAVALLDEIKRARTKPKIAASWMTKNAELTDANAAVFDSANSFAGCIPGIHEVLRRQGLLASTRCLDPHERLSPGQAAELTRVEKAYPWLVDDAFVASNLDRWLA